MERPRPGATALFAAILVSNTRRTGEFTFDGRRYLLRRVLFPENPRPEYFVVDLIEHRDMTGVSLADLEERLIATLKQGRWDRELLVRMAERRDGIKATWALVERCLAAAGEAS